MRIDVDDMIPNRIGIITANHFGPTRDANAQSDKRHESCCGMQRGIGHNQCDRTVLFGATARLL